MNRPYRFEILRRFISIRFKTSKSVLFTAKKTIVFHLVLTALSFCLVSLLHGPALTPVVRYGQSKIAFWLVRDGPFENRASFKSGIFVNVNIT